MENIRELLGDLLTVDETAKVLKFNAHDIKLMLKHGDLPGVKLHGEWRVSSRQLAGLFGAHDCLAATASKAKIGKLVRDTMKRLIDARYLPAAELQNLQDLDYCRKTFGLNYPLLREVDPVKDLRHQGLVKGHSRYWKLLFSSRYLVTSEWYERHRVRFLAWAKCFDPAFTDDC